MARRLLAPALLLPALAAAQTNLNVDVTRALRPVEARHFGVNAVMWDGQTATTTTLGLYQAAGTAFFRIPGGSLSDSYDWSANRTYASAGVLNSWSWAAGLDKFAALASGVGAQTIVAVNYGSGTPEMAAAWVAYANAPATLQGTGADVTLGTDFTNRNWQTAGAWSALRAAAPLGTDDGRNHLRHGRPAPYGHQYWEIGNECYGSWETDYHGTPWNGNQGAPWDPVTYANAAKNYIAKMKAVDPSIKIGVVAQVGEDALDPKSPVHFVTNPRTGVSHKGWTPVMLATLKSLGVTPDFLIYHRYEQAPGAETDAGLLAGPVSGSPYTKQSWAADAADLRAQLNDYLGTSAAAGVELFVTENNSVYSDPGKQSTSLVNALYYADSLANVLKTEFTAFFWWALRNGTPTSGNTILGNQSASLYGWRQYGDYGVLSSPNTAGATDYNTPYPVYYAMKLMARFARPGDTIVQATSANNLLPVYACKHADGSVAVLVINKSPTADQSGMINLTGLVPAKTATVYSYGIPQDEAARTGSGSPDLATTSIGNAAASFAYTFPKYSATVIVLAPDAPTIVLQPAPAMTVAGRNATFAVKASSPSAATYRWQRLPAGSGTWADLSDGGVYGGTGTPSLTVATILAMNGDQFRCVVSNAQGSTTTRAVVLNVSAQPGNRFYALAARAQVGAGSDVLIPGLAITGTAPKRVIIRALGPALQARAINNFLPDPVLQLVTLAGQRLGENDNWDSGDPQYRAAFQQVGLADLADGSKDAVIIATLAPGLYTPTILDKNGASGVALVEFYDLDAAHGTLAAISTRAQVGTGNDVLIPGIVIEGTSAKKLLVRVAGPDLVARGVGNALADPEFEIKDITGTSIYANDNWDHTDAALVAATTAVGAPQFPAGSKDAAILVELAPGLYTIVIRGVNNTSGVALVELFDAP